MFVVRPFQATTLAWWHGERENLDLSPAYQRSSGVWSQRDKAYLIDSIINGYDIPKFYIADFSYVSSNLNETNKPYAVIDGRQRFEAIFDFLDSRIPLNSDMEYFGEEKINLAGLNYRELKNRFPKLAGRVENFNITVMSVITDELGKINDLFVRLNKSKPLTGAEVRSALLGTIPKHIRQIAQSEFFTRSVSFSNTRKQSENIAAKLLLIEHRGSFVETKKVNLDRFAQEAVLTETEFEASAQRVDEVLRVMANSFVPSDPLLRTSGQIPVYYWLARNHPDAPLREAIKDFEEFRKGNPTHGAVVSFNQANRSTNDWLSYRVRYRVLEEFIEHGWSIPEVIDVADKAGV